MSSGIRMKSLTSNACRALSFCLGWRVRALACPGSCFAPGVKGYLTPQTSPAANGETRTSDKNIPNNKNIISNLSGIIKYYLYIYPPTPADSGDRVRGPMGKQKPSGDCRQGFKRVCFVFEACLLERDVRQWTARVVPTRIALFWFLLGVSVLF